MTTDGTKRAYNLTIIRLDHIIKVPQTPALYVRPHLAGSKLCETKVIRNPTQAWEHTCTLTAGLSSVLSLHLKHSRSWRSPILIGFVDISVGDLLAQCRNDQPIPIAAEPPSSSSANTRYGVATLALRNKHDQAVGSLAVQLLGSTSPADIATVGGVSHDLEPKLPASIPPPVRNVVKEFSDDVLDSLKQIVVKANIVADLVGETAESRHYANIAWRVMESAFQAAQKQSIWAEALKELVISMVATYSSVADTELRGATPDLDDILIRIALQTIECGIFVLQYTSTAARQSIGEVQRTVSRLSVALARLKAELGPGMAPSTTFAPVLEAQSHFSMDAFKDMKPANMDAAEREMCLSGTRVDVLQDIFLSLVNPTAEKNILWLHGPAGSGKSTILNTLAHDFLQLCRRGAFLFWDRDKPDNSDPSRVIHTLAYQLARFDADFARELDTQLKARPSIMESSLDLQFQYLLQKPLTTLSERRDYGPVIIVLDALDECGTLESRGKLLKTLSTGLKKLPKTFRILIASRDEPDIRDAMSHLNPDMRDAPMGDESTSLDIQLLFQKELSSNADAFLGYRLPPYEEIVRKLVILSGGLFIWASTTIRFIKSGPPAERLRKVLSASAHSRSQSRLDDLYRVALTHPFEPYDENEIQDVHSILGAIVVAREQLTDEQLSWLLELEIGIVQAALSRLQPLLQGGHGRPVRVLHASFIDFLERCEDSKWRIITYDHHLGLTSHCLRVMGNGLKFNICAIETSYYRNKDIGGIQERVDRAISPALMYASQYWADHLESGSAQELGSHPLVDAIRDFFFHRFLYWIEVFSVKEQVSAIPGILRKATSWAKKYEGGLEAVISEASKFVHAFAYPMGQSVPHIYLSALPFSPAESTVLQCTRDAFRNTLSVERGRSKRWPVAHQILTKHTGAVTSVGLSLDGTRMVSGSDDKTVRIWDAVSGAPIGEPLQGHALAISSVAFSPDGTRIVSGSWDKTVQIWDAVSGAMVGEPLKGHSQSVWSVAFSPDGTRIVSGSWDKTVRIWDSVSGAPLGQPLQGHSLRISSVAFSPDGTRIVSGSWDKTVRIWDAASHAPIGEPLQGHSDGVLSVAFSPNGTRIVSGSSDKTVRIWDAASGAPVGGPLQGHSDNVSSVGFSPDGTRIISGSLDRTVQIWDTVSGAAIGGPLPGHSDGIRSVAFSPDGTRIISGSLDKTVRILDAMSGAPIGEPLQGHSDSVRSVAFCPDGTRIVSGSLDKTARIWDVVSGAPTSEPLQGHSHGIWSIALSPDSTRIVSGSWDKTIRIWDAASGALINEPLQGHSDGVSSVSFSPDGSRIVSGAQDKTIRIWDAVSGAPIGEPLQGHFQGIWSVAFSPDGTRIVSGSWDKTIRIWDAVSGAPIGEPLPGHSDGVLSVSFSPDGSRIVSGSSDKTVRIWDAVSGAPVGEPLQGHSDDVSSVAFSPDGACIISGSLDKTVQIWDVALGVPIGEPLRGHSDSVRSVAFSPGGTCIVSGSNDKTVRIWDAADARHANASTDKGAVNFSNNSVLQEDGWMTTNDGQLLFWVPPRHRLGLFRPGTLVLIGAHPTQLNMERFVHGARWTQCRTGNY